MCGVVGLIGTADAAREAFLGLTTLQHRGQDAAGILTYDRDGFHRVKNVGLVDSVFNRENMATLSGSLAVGHTRYSTIGKGDLIDVQPFLISYPYGLGMAHNGNTINVASLAEDLKKRGRRRLLTHSDTEIILNLLAEGLAQASGRRGAAGPGAAQAPGPDLSFDEICEAVGYVFEKVNGSFSVVSLIADHGLLAFRDPIGNRPLIWGRRPARRAGEAGPAGGEAHMIASESVALLFNGYEPVRDLKPGEVMLIDGQGNVHSRVVKAREARHCMFEWVYFASPESVIDGAPVYGTRINLGRNLGAFVKKRLADEGFEADMVVPVPDSSRVAAIALSEELDLPYREVLIKNRYIKRTFILDSHDKRQSAVKLKLSPVRSEIAGKRVLLVDDSIVRGTTSRKIIELVRQAGAKQVYFVSTCPPIRYPCFYGIDFPSKGELIAQGRSLEEIEGELGADAVIYQDIEGLRGAITGSASAVPPEVREGLSSPCMACLDGCYPTDVSDGEAFARSREKERVR